ncbi:MAG: hypothetical protein AB7K04_10285 [Pseudorhodoplanes sp.]
MTEQAQQKLAIFERKLSGLTDHFVQISNNEAYDGASVFLSFSDGSKLRADYWRLLKNNLAVLSSFDHQQQYGLPKPIDARADLSRAINGAHVLTARLDKQTGDLLFAFSGQAHLQVFNLTGYEIWDMAFADRSGEYSNFAMSYLYEAAAAR